MMYEVYVNMITLCEEVGVGSRLHTYIQHQHTIIIGTNSDLERNGTIPKSLPVPIRIAWGYDFTAIVMASYMLHKQLEGEKYHVIRDV